MVDMRYFILFVGVTVFLEGKYRVSRIERGKLFSYSESFCEGGPNPREGSISTSGFGPGGPYPLADMGRGVQI